MARVVVMAALLLTANVAGFFAWMGALSSIEVRERLMGPYCFVYREVRGAGAQDVERMTRELGESLRAAEFEEMRPFQVHYPDARGDPPSQIGFLISQSEIGRLAYLNRQFRYRIIPMDRYMVARFPWKNRFSYSLGMFRARGAFADWRLTHGYRRAASMSLYEQRGITYLQPVVK